MKYYIFGKRRAYDNMEVWILIEFIDLDGRIYIFYDGYFGRGR